MSDIYTADQVASMMSCSTKTVENLARNGVLAGIKPGGVWVFPAVALVASLNELAVQRALQRRSPAVPVAVSVPAATGARRGPKPRARPTLVDMR